jgi:hypothetical protein
MKQLIALIVLSLATTFAVAAEEKKPETQKVCVDKTTKDGKPVLGKDGKPTQECKQMKVHKKLEGTKVPEKK